MTLTYSINEEFTVELDGEQLREDYDYYREIYPDLNDTKILKNIYNDNICQDINGMMTGLCGFNFDDTLNATLDLTEDQFIALAREELDLESYPEDADGQLHLF